MNLKDIFLSDGKLRSGWRLLLFLLISFPPLYLLTLLFWKQLLIRYIIIFFLLLIISFLFVRFVDKRPVGTVGFMFHSGWIRQYFQGILLGIVLVSILFLYELSSGFIIVRFNTVSLNLIKDIFILAMIKTLFQSAFEELFFRGYMFQNLIESTSAIFAIIIISAIFGAGHLLTPNAYWLTGINLSVFGIMLSLGYIRTRSLWLSSGLHFSWNFFMRNIYSLPVSGSKATDSLFLVETHGPHWLTGGNYGPEGGVPGLIVMIIACIFIYFWRGFRASPEIIALWQK